MFYSGNLIYLQPIGPRPSCYEIRNFPKIIISSDDVTLESESETIFTLRRKYNDYVITKITVDNEVVLHSCNKFYNGLTYSQGLGIVFGNSNNFLKIYSVDSVGPDGRGEIKWGTINNWDKSCTKKEDEYFINATDIPIAFNDSIKIQTYSFCESEPRNKKYKVYVRYKLDE